MENHLFQLIPVLRVRLSAFEGAARRSMSGATRFRRLADRFWTPLGMVGVASEHPRTCGQTASTENAHRRVLSVVAGGTVAIAVLAADVVLPYDAYQLCPESAICPIGMARPYLWHVEPGTVMMSTVGSGFMVGW